jgi:hypothetical protein
MEAQQPKKQRSSAEKHRRQFIWQILVPIIAAALVFVGFGVLASLPATTGRVATGQWAAISMIWMIIPVIVMTVLFMAITGGLIYLMARLLRIVPIYTRLANLYVQIIGVRLQTISNRAPTPVIKLQSWQAGWKAFWRSLRRQKPA